MRPSGSSSQDSAPRRTLAGALSGLDSAQKPGAGVPAYTRWVNRRLARYAAAVAYRLGWSANAVTAASAVVSGAAIALLVARPATPALGVGIAVLLAAGYVLDSADGQVARLARTVGPAGEWVDHVVDSVRTPAIHLGVLVAAAIAGAPLWLLGVAIVYTLLSVGQFMSQVLGEQLRRSMGAMPERRFDGALRSWVLLPSDMGVLCWTFLLWGFPPVFAVGYAALFAVNVVHTVISMRRRYVELGEDRRAITSSKSG